MRLLLRLFYAFVCLVVWPFYYLGLLGRWVVDGLRWLSFRETLDGMAERDERVWHGVRNPPYLDRLRG